MKEQKTNAYTVVLIVMILIQMVFIVLNFGYAYLGEYTDNQPSNFWSEIWGGKEALGWLASNIISGILGIIGLVTKKEKKAQAVAAIILLLSIGLSGISILFAIGAHF